MVAFIALLVFIAIDLSDVTGLILILLMVINIITVIYNIIPRGENDGGLLLMGSRSDSNRRLLHIMFFRTTIINDLAKGIRVRNLPAEMFTLASDMAIENKYIAYIVLINAARLDDMGDHTLALKQYERIRLANLPPSCEECKQYKIAASVSEMYQYATTSPCFETAKKIYSDQCVRDFLSRDIPANWQILSAYHFFVLREEAKGLELLSKAKSAAISETNLGIRDAMIEGLEILEGLMQVQRKMNMR